MKKSFFLSILAVGALVACSKSEVVDTKFDQAISFENYVGRDAQTKAEVLTKENVGKVGVYAYYTGKDGWTTSSPTNLWGGVLEVNSNGSLGNVNGAQATEKYWANADDKYSFFAYAPMVDGKVTMPNTVNPIINFTVQSDIQDQVDLLYSEPIKDKVPTFFTGGTVSLNMKHALSRLTVKAKATGENFKFDIKEITVEGNFRTTGNLPLSTGEWDEATVSDQTNYLFHRNGTVGTDNAVTYTPYVAENALTTVDYASYTYYTPGATDDADAVANTVTNNYLMVIPSKVTMNVVVKYTTYYMGQESALITSAPIEVTIDLAKGKAYSITLNFSHAEQPITFEVSVDDWTDVDGNKNQETNTDKNIAA